jgi:hypothetical protein
MTQQEILALKVNDPIFYQETPDDPLLAGSVLQNGPPLDPEGNSLSDTEYLFIIRVGAAGQQVSWDPSSFPNGIPQITKAAPPPGVPPTLRIDPPLVLKFPPT